MKLHQNLAIGHVAILVSIAIAAASARASSSSDNSSRTSAQSSSAMSATVTWQPSTEKDLAGYKLYVGNAPGAYGPPIDVGNVTSYVVTNLQLGNTYYFAVSAYDMNGNESEPSAVLSKSIY